MTTWRCKTEQDRAMAVRAVQHRALPFTAELVKGIKRSNEQNRLSRLWCREAEEQGDMTAEEYRGHCKLNFGVPIMCSQSELFAEKYDRIIKPLPYEQKLELMQEPFDFPVTRLMNTANEKKYLDQMWRFFTDQGFRLTDPERRGEAA